MPDSPSATRVEHSDDRFGFFRRLIEILKVVLSNRRYWVASVWILLAFIPFNALSGLWAAPYCTQVLGFSDDTTGLVMFAFTISIMVFSLVWAHLGTIWRIKRLLVVAGSILSAIVCIAFICTSRLSPIATSALFALDAIGPSSTCNLVFHWVREAFAIELVGTSMGAVNFFWWVSGAVGQLVTGSIIRAYGVTEDGSYTEKGYRIGLWWLGVALTTLSVIPAAFMKYQYPEEAAPEGDVPEHDESKSTSQIEDFSGFSHASER
jgi:MFS family permease